MHAAHGFEMSHNAIGEICAGDCNLLFRVACGCKKRSKEHVRGQRPGEGVGLLQHTVHDSAISSAKKPDRIRELERGGVLAVVVAGLGSYGRQQKAPSPWFCHT